MNHWLVKSEPDEWSWDDHRAAPQRTARWDGVRNHQAANNLRAMRRGDRVLFYHSGKQRAIVGVMEVVRKAYPDPKDESGRFVAVDMKAIEPLDRPVTLDEVKADAKLKDMPLARHPRLSVQPVTAGQWKRILELAKDGRSDS